ncbi:hypothetical protein BGZ76_007379 [Entomortierella beljakovae]|nr:hypothetical protein BGZ76_007379 [Entomortierella beljakovae]
MENNRWITRLSISFPDAYDWQVLHSHDLDEKVLLCLFRCNGSSLKGADLRWKRRMINVPEFNDVISIADQKYTLDTGHQHTLIICNVGYPVFDYIVGRTFIQRSETCFKQHNKADREIDNAFTRPFMSDAQNRNQIEVYLDSVFGRGHRAIITADHKFLVTQNGVRLRDFNIVYFVLNNCKKNRKLIVSHPYVFRVLV